MDKSVGTNLKARTVGNPSVTAVTFKPTTSKTETKKASQSTVEEELELAKKEAEENQRRIAQLEAEKKKRDEQEAIRLASEKAEAEERKQFQAFKQFMATTGINGAIVSTSNVTEPKAIPQEVKEEVVSNNYISTKSEPSGGLFGENTSYLIRVMGGTVVVLVVLYLAILSLFGKANDSVSLMFDSFPLRMYINLLIEVVAIGIGFLGMRLLFPEQYKYVHSKINSLCSPKKDWEQCSPEFRLRFASEQLWRFAFLFVLALMVIFT